jgi:hypothetical protein
MDRKDLRQYGGGHKAGGVVIRRKSNGHSGLPRMNLRCVYGEHPVSIGRDSLVCGRLAAGSVKLNRFRFRPSASSPALPGCASPGPVRHDWRHGPAEETGSFGVQQAESQPASLAILGAAPPPGAGPRAPTGGVPHGGLTACGQVAKQEEHPVSRVLCV